MNRTVRVAPALTALILGTSALGFAAQAQASPCNPVTMSMTPQPVLSCPDPAPAAPIVGASGPVPGAPLPDALPPPGQPPAIPPTFNADGTQNSGSDGFLGDVMNQFGNGVPSDFIYGPMPAPALTPPPAP